MKIENKDIIDKLIETKVCKSLQKFIDNIDKLYIKAQEDNNKSLLNAFRVMEILFSFLAMATISLTALLIASLLIFKPVFVAKTLMIAAVVLLLFSCYKIFISLKEDSKENEK